MPEPPPKSPDRERGALRIAVVADAHIDGPGGEGAELFEQLEALPEQGCTDLLLLGDLFHVWVGSLKYETPAIREFMEVAARLRESGVRLHYVEGNRDFFLADSSYAEIFDRYGLELGFESPDRNGQLRRILAVHGDRANPDDRPYRFWAFVSKSAPVRFLIRRLPGRLAHSLVDRAEREIAKTNQKHCQSIPEDALRAYGRDRLAEGYDLVVMGHFHQPAVYHLEGGEVRLIDAWFNSRTIEWLH